MPVLNAAELQEKGNAFYRNSQIIEAIATYRQAVEALPEDALPLVNLSAAYFEAGDYQSCAEAAISALRLTSEKDVGLREKLRLRLTNAYLHQHKPEMAGAILSELSASHVEYVALTKYLVLMQASCQLHPSLAESKCSIISKIPRYKPALEAIPEYYVFGHDNVRSLYDEALRENTEAKASISLLFAGLGDARHLYKTIIAMAKSELFVRSQRSFHIVVNDVKPHVLARNLIIWVMLDELSRSAHDSDLDPRILNTIFFIYCGAIMPAEAYKRLQGTIVTAIKMLETGNTFPTWISIPAGDRPNILAVLRSWQTEAAKLYTVGYMIKRNVEAYRAETITEELLTTSKDKFALFRKEVDCFLESLMLIPGESILEQDEPALAKLWTRFKKKPSPKLSKEIKSYVTSHWNPNVTMFDVDREKTGEYFVDARPDPWRTPQQLIGSAGNLESGKGGCIFDYVAAFFQMTAIAIKSLGPRLKVRTTLGDITDIMEKWRPEIPTVSTEDGQGVVAPVQFDRIHLSNIPDYVGGSLFSFLYAVPLLKYHSSSFMLSTCLRNPPLWKSIEHFNNEYLLINRLDDLEKLMQTVHAGNWEDPDNILTQKLQMWPLSDYQKWRKSSGTSHTFDCLLPRPAFNRWLFGLFFKLCLPVRRGSNPQLGVDAMVFAPCNLTVFFRLLIHLHSVGYPSHWLSSVLINILTDNVHTAARPSVSSPLDIAETNAIRPIKHVRTSVYLAEMSTLTIMFLRQLPFAVCGRDVSLPAPSEVFEYTVDFQVPVLKFDTQRPDFILVFRDVEIVIQDVARNGGRMPPTGWIRGALQQDENNNPKNPCYHVVSTWKWEDSPQRATFWMREDVVNSMMARAWTCDIVRTDDWSVASRQLKSDALFSLATVKKGRCWAEERKTEPMNQALAFRG